MRILHTSDWHLGKYLKDYSRIEEQEEFLEELVEIVEKNSIDMILISGDIYDTFIPSAMAEKLFFRYIKKLSNDGDRIIIIIAGNHDSPNRISAANPLALEQGIIIVGTLKTVIPKGNYETYKTIDSGEGFLEIEFKNEKIVILTIPYVNEKRINEIIFDSSDEEKSQIDYSEKIKMILKNLSQKYRSDTINLLMAHLYMAGGEMESSERDISLGGSFSVFSDVIPKNTHYAAFGHLHRAQKVAKSPIKHAYYSGSPIQYHKNEMNHQKYLYIVDINIANDAEVIVEKVLLKNYRPIEEWKVNSIEEAIEMCEEKKDENTYVFLEIKTDRPLLKSEIKNIRSTKEFIIDIFPVLEFEGKDSYEDETKEKSILENFSDFYLKSRGASPSDEIIELFLSMLIEEEEIK